MNSTNNLSLINPDTIESMLVSNMPFDESFDLRNSDYISSEVLDQITDSDSVDSFERSRVLEQEMDDAYDRALQKKILENTIWNDKFGDGKMEYILDKNDKLMMRNAWLAITLTNTWDFVSQEIETFMLSNDPRILKISEKMEELGYREHSGCSFGFTMRNMQFLARKGEEEFKKLFDENNEKNSQKVIINF